MADKLQDLPLGQEIIDLVVAARNVTYSTPLGFNAHSGAEYDGMDDEDPEIAALDAALEKFAAIVPWENEPEDDEIEVSGISMIADERLRQIRDEGYSSSRDDGYQAWELSRAAAAYALAAGGYENSARDLWPWAIEHYKPRSSLEDLKRAGALIAAEIDRLLRGGPIEIQLDGVTSKERAERIAKAMAPDPRDDHIAELRAMVERGHAREQDLVQFGYTLQAELTSAWKRLSEAEAIIDDAGAVLRKIHRPDEGETLENGEE